MNKGISSCTSRQSEDINRLTWELTICLMRNILCHEYCFQWSSVQEMIRISLHFFRGQRNVEEMFLLYERTVIRPYFSKDISKCLPADGPSFNNADSDLSCSSGAIVGDDPTSKYPSSGTQIHPSSLQFLLYNPSLFHTNSLER